MNKKVAILRGINVGGKRKILKTQLISLFEDLGFTHIITYIQSGNIIFQTVNKQSDVVIQDRIEKAIKKNFGFDVPTVIRSYHELEKALNRNPFYKVEEPDINKLSLTFLKEKPTEEHRLKVETYDYPPDQFVIKDREIFILCEGSYHLSKLTNNFFENKLKVSATTRSWKTVLKLLELSK